jgi:hypothetical protein
MGYGAVQGPIGAVNLYSPSRDPPRRYPAIRGTGH